MSQNNRYHQGSLFFWLMMQGSGAGAILVTKGSGADPGGPKTYGSPNTGCLVSKMQNIII